MDECNSINNDFHKTPNSLDVSLSVLFNLHLASIAILMCFFLLFLVFKNFFINPDVIENVKSHRAPIIPAGAPITVASDAIEMLPDNIDKTFNFCLLVHFL